MITAQGTLPSQSSLGGRQHLRGNHSQESGLGAPPMLRKRSVEATLEFQPSLGSYLGKLPVYWRGLHGGPPKRYAHITSLKPGYVWKQGPCRCNSVKDLEKLILEGLGET